MAKCSQVSNENERKYRVYLSEWDIKMLAVKWILILVVLFYVDPRAKIRAVQICLFYVLEFKISSVKIIISLTLGKLNLLA